MFTFPNRVGEFQKQAEEYLQQQEKKGDETIRETKEAIHQIYAKESQKIQEQTQKIQETHNQELQDLKRKQEAHTQYLQNQQREFESHLEQAKEAKSSQDQEFKMNLERNKKSKEEEIKEKKRILEESMQALKQTPPNTQGNPTYRSTNHPTTTLQNPYTSPPSNLSTNREITAGILSQIFPAQSTPTSTPTSKQNQTFALTESSSTKGAIAQILATMPKDSNIKK